MSRRPHTKPFGLNLMDKMNTTEMEESTDSCEPESTSSVVIVETENEPLYESDESGMWSSRHNTTVAQLLQ
jgi:hypothetical protein